MPPDSQTQSDRFASAMRKLEELRHYKGPAAGFWLALLEAMAQISGAGTAVALRKIAGPTGNWQRVAIWPPAQSPTSGLKNFTQVLEALAVSALAENHSLRLLEGAAESVPQDCAIAVRFGNESSTDHWVGAFYFPACSPAERKAATTLLRLMQDTPAVCVAHSSVQNLQLKLSQFSSVMDLTALLNAQSRFMAVAMTLCNELAARHKCDRVSLGWLEHEYIRLQTISHTERFEKKMEAVKVIEQTMEESLDQDEIIVWPAPETDTRITADHARYAEAQKVKFLCSVPLRLNGQPLGVITCERNTEPFTEEEQRLLTLGGEMAVRRLSELKLTDRWFGARLASVAREQFARAVGVRHTWAKVIAVLVALALAILLFGRMNYRVEATFILRTDDVGILSAPFEGYIEEVPAEIGDTVNAGAILLKLDTRDLLLQEAAAAADFDRYNREAEKARAANALAEMRVSEAQAEQSRVRLELIRYRLAQAALKAPFAGVVVEGDLKKRIGAPVKQGDALFKVARTDRMYVECNVDERDIHDVRGDATGEFAFASQPKLRFPMQLTRIEPVAQVKEQDNLFVVRAQFTGPLQDWWRPGMSGVAKINVGKRTIGWIIAHRTIDFLRMYFWW